MSKSPQYANAVPSTSNDPNDPTTRRLTPRPLKFDMNVDEILGTPKPKEGTDEKKWSGARVSGLPRCVSDAHF